MGSYTSWGCFGWDRPADRVICSNSYELSSSRFMLPSAKACIRLVGFGNFYKILLYFSDTDYCVVDPVVFWETGIASEPCLALSVAFWST